MPIVRTCVALAVVLLTGAAAGPEARIPRGVAEVVRDERLTRYAVAMADLGGDRRPEALIYAMADVDGDGQANLCGSGGCNLYVLTPVPTGYRRVGRTTLTRPPIRILATRTHGWRDLSVRVAGGGIGRGYHARLRFDGRSYPSNPTVPPTSPWTGRAGRTVIADEPASAAIVPARGSGRRRD